MAGLIDRAIAGQVSASELALDVLDSDPQPASEQVVTEPTDGLPPAEIQRVRIAPLGRSAHHDRALRKLRSFAP
jgi:hypothetical protein